jgi:hypothetical protein
MLMQLVIPFTLAFHTSTHWGSQQVSQSKRLTAGESFDDSNRIAEWLDAASRQR